MALALPLSLPVCLSAFVSIQRSDCLPSPSPPSHTPPLYPLPQKPLLSPGTQWDTFRGPKPLIPKSYIHPPPVTLQVPRGRRSVGL